MPAIPKSKTFCASFAGSRRANTIRTLFRYLSNLASSCETLTPNTSERVSLSFLVANFFKIFGLAITVITGVLTANGSPLRSVISPR